MTRKFWLIALAVFLILWGLLTLTNLRFEGQNIIIGVLAVAAGVLALLEK